MNEVRLNPLDTAWLFTESRATPNHVGGLLLFHLPEQAPREFLSRLMSDFRAHRRFGAPWNRRLKVPFTKNPLPSWVTEDDADIDLEYHLRHAALPWPGGERELGELIGRLQSTPIDLTRPPWECTLIEGLEDGRFAMFVKMHHALIDGISGMKLLQRAMSDSADASVAMPPFWDTTTSDEEATRPPGHTRKKRKATAEDEGVDPAGAAAAVVASVTASVTAGVNQLVPTLASATNAAMEGLSFQAKALPQLFGAFGQILKRIGDPSDGLAVPFDAPRSSLNGRVREKRRFATQQFEMARLRALAQAAGCTLNDVVLALCGGALRRFLLERDELPAKSLTAGIPVSVRPADDEGTGNAISFIVATLGTNVEEPLARLHAIQSSVQHAKAHLQSLSRPVMQQYTLLLMAPTLVTLLTGIGGRTPPMFNITISNVPGPDRPLYFRGAQLLSIYPASIVTHGQALNITCESYNGQMNFGFTGCHASLPSLQKVAVYATEALQELEAACLPRQRRSRNSSPRSAAVKTTTGPTRRRKATLPANKAAE
jgi:WS/DGAT/MGAT family acyltransferase